MSQPNRILLVDDHPILRAGLAALIEAEADFEVAGQGGTGEEAIERVSSLRPDLVLMDLDTRGMGGLEAIRQVVALGGETRVLVITSQSEVDSAMPVLEAGGSGYVQKTGAGKDLIEAMRRVVRGEVFLCPSATKLLL